MPAVAVKKPAARRAVPRKKPVVAIPGFSPRRAPPVPVGTIADVR